MERGILITGASGLIGSALAHRFAHEPGWRVVGLDRRPPGAALVAATPGTQWIEGDLADPGVVGKGLDALHGCRERVVCHLAAYYDFEERWCDEYDRSNVHAVRTLRDACAACRVDHLIFSSSMAGHEPPPVGRSIDEESELDASLPYGRSKRLGEDLLRESAGRLPVTILRIGGVFTERCELPPLYSLLDLWLGPWPLSRTLVGQGRTAMPYIHRADLVELIRLCALGHGEREACKVLLACGHRAVSHRELFAVVHPERRALHLPTLVAGLGLRARLWWAGVRPESRPVERSWMLRYADRPMRVDNHLTRAVTGWHCREERDVLRQLPRMLSLARRDPDAWHALNRRRNAAQYVWEGEDEG